MQEDLPFNYKGYEIGLNDYPLIFKYQAVSIDDCDAVIECENSIEALKKHIDWLQEVQEDLHDEVLRRASDQTKSEIFNAITQ